MTVEFFAEQAGSSQWVELLAESDPGNPFATAAYLRTRQGDGSEAWLVGLWEDGRPVSGCAAFFKAGRLNRSLEVPSLPRAAEEATFWEGLFRFCRMQGVTQVDLYTFGSQAIEIPRFTWEIARTSRQEFVLRLPGRDLQAGLCANHRRNINRARRANVVVECREGRKASEDHARTSGMSLERRRRRGEVVSGVIGMHYLTNLVESGVGQLFQALSDGVVISSVLVLRARSGAYYCSAGTSSQGMASGASHLLVFEIARRLQAEGAEVFNLGGAPAESSLARFKIGFGTETVGLSAVSLYLGSRWRRKLITAAERWRSICMTPKILRALDALRPKRPATSHLI